MRRVRTHGGDLAERADTRARAKADRDNDPRTGEAAGASDDRRSRWSRCVAVSRLLHRQYPQSKHPCGLWRRGTWVFCLARRARRSRARRDPHPSRFEVYRNCAIFTVAIACRKESISVWLWDKTKRKRRNSMYWNLFLKIP